jgi:acetoacetyl-CoA reductase
MRASPRDMTFRKMDKTSWDSVTKTNLDSVFNMTKPGHRRHVRTRLGPDHQCVVSERTERRVRSDQLLGCESRHARFTKALALEYARKGVTVNTISPGYIGTKDGPGDSERHTRFEDSSRRFPVGRLGKPEEVAGLVAYLCSEEAAFVTGANIAINGGQHMY